jgi:ADP-ribosyl-[dinitrogen reductase] hydrolase
VATTGYLSSKKHSFGIGQTVLKAVNLGNDSDTVGAIYGQIAGAYYDVRNIPAEWPEVFYIRNEILDIASQLFRSKI